MINSQPTPRGLTIPLTGDGKGKTTAAPQRNCLLRLESNIRR